MIRERKRITSLIMVCMLLCFSKTHIRSNRPYNSKHRHNGRKGKQAEAFKG